MTQTALTLTDPSGLDDYMNVPRVETCDARQRLVDLEDHIDGLQRQSPGHDYSYIQNELRRIYHMIPSGRSDFDIKQQTRHEMAELVRIMSQAGQKSSFYQAIMGLIVRDNLKRETGQ